jgi:hypothetical protein
VRFLAQAQGRVHLWPRARGCVFLGVLQPLAASNLPTSLALYRAVGNRRGGAGMGVGSDPIGRLAHLPLSLDSPCIVAGKVDLRALSRKSWDLPLGAWVAGHVCFGLGTNYPCRICPRLPATTDLLALAGTRRYEVHEGDESATRSRAPNEPPRNQHRAGYRSRICLNRRRNTN